jgi:hypothetical protein
MSKIFSDTEFPHVQNFRQSEKFRIHLREAGHAAVEHTCGVSTAGGRSAVEHTYSAEYPHAAVEQLVQSGEGSMRAKLMSIILADKFSTRYIIHRWVKMSCD